MVVTEEELREAWKNGAGALPSFPPGTRFTPSACDFLQAHAPAAGCAAVRPEAAGAESGAAGERLLRSPPGSRLVLTSRDVAGLVAEAREGAVLRVHPSATVTDAAKELLRKAGWRVLPYIERAQPEQSGAKAALSDAVAQRGDPPIRGGERPAPPSTAALFHAAPAQSPLAAPRAPSAPQAADERAELAGLVKRAVLARIPRPVDEALLDEVLRRVLAGLQA